jgi:hypothetical protein
VLYYNGRDRTQAYTDTVNRYAITIPQTINDSPAKSGTGGHLYARPE